VVAALLGAAQALGAPPDAGAAPCAPPVMLWAWERPSHLETIDPATTGVAFLARTLRLGDGAFTVRPRRQPLAVPPGTHLVAVVRIEPDAPMGRAPAPPDGRALAAAVAAVARPGVAGVQVDFDAPRSQRTFYRELLRAIRVMLPPATGLSMTALASWALGDAWLDDLPVDEVVPMLFRMGADDGLVRRRLAAGGDFTSARARRSVGLALDEAWPVVPVGRRVYLFDARPWSAARVALALAQARQGQRQGHALPADSCASSS